MSLTALRIAYKPLRYSAEPCAKPCESWQANTVYTYKQTPSLTRDAIILHLVTFVGFVVLHLKHLFYLVPIEGRSIVKK